MTRKKKHKHHNGSQKGQLYNDGAHTKDNKMSYEEMKKAIDPTRNMNDG